MVHVISGVGVAAQAFTPDQTESHHSPIVVLNDCDVVAAESGEHRKSSSNQIHPDKISGQSFPFRQTLIVSQESCDD